MRDKAFKVSGKVKKFRLLALKAPPRTWLHSLTYFIEFMISSLNLCHLETLPTHE